MNVLEYFEELTENIEDSEIPEPLLIARILSVTSGCLTSNPEIEDEEEDDLPQAETYRVLEFVVQGGLWDEPVKFLMLSENTDSEEWLYAPTLEDFIEERFYGQDNLTTTYEVNDEEVF